MKKILSALFCSVLLVVMVMSVAACTDAETYRLTVQDPEGHILENLQKSYKAGEAVTVKTGIIYDASLVALLDGVSLGSGIAVQTGDSYTHWEFYFTMPAQDAVLSFEIKDGFLPGELDADGEIKAAYLAKHPDYNLTESDIGLHHYGEFGGTFVLIMNLSGFDVAQVETYQTVDGITFCFAEDESFDVYREGEVYTLQEAFDLGFLSHDNLYSVWERHRAENYFLYDGGRVELRVEEVQEIVAAYLETHENHSLTEEDIRLRCFGVFNDAYVLFVDEAGAAYSDVISYETVSGVEFIYSSSHSLTVYSKGEFCSVTDAFEKGLLTHDELLTAQKNYRVGHEYLYR